MPTPTASPSTNTPDAPPRAMRRVQQPFGVLALLLGLSGIAALGAAMPPAPAPATAHVAQDAPLPERVATACGTTNPYFVVAVHARGIDDAAHADAPALIAFRDSGVDESSETVVLATQGEVGAVFGLAYDAARAQIYAAAFHKVGLRHGPGGPGAIYRVDLASGGVSTFATMDVGDDHHTPALQSDPTADDSEAAEHVAVTGIGDIDVDEGGTRLFATNLSLGRVEVLGLPDGAVVDRFAHAAARERWRESARPFALAVRGGNLYQGIVDSQQVELPPPPKLFDATVYRTGLDGDGAESVSRLWLGYDRGTRWSPWNDTADPGAIDQPLLVDIDFRPGQPPLEGDLLLGLRDRSIDMAPERMTTATGGAARSAGDLLATVRDGNVWRAVVGTSLYDDRNPSGQDVSFGGLATLPGLDVVMAPALRLALQTDMGPRAAGGVWWDEEGGRVLRTEPLLDVSEAEGLDPDYLGLGDAEALCARRTDADPELRATATQEAAVIATATQEAAGRVTATAAALTATARPSAVAATRTAHAPTEVARATVARQTATALAPTIAAAAPTRTAAATFRAATATAAVAKATDVGPIAAHMLTQAAPATRPPATATALASRWAEVQQTCGSDNPYFVTTCFVPSLDLQGNEHDDDWLAEQVMVVAFNDSQPEDMSAHVPLAWQPEVGAVFGEAFDIDRSQLYVGAYTKRLADLGPLGAGGIYRLDLSTMTVTPWAWLDAGQDPHRMTSNFDEPAAQWVGRLGLGDLELAPEHDELFAWDLYHKLIWRFSVPDGKVLGAYPHGGVGEAWEADARPFALGWHDDWLYHGVVDSRETDPDGARDMTAYVYRSRHDGTGMHEVARFRLDYARQPAWEPWEATHDDQGADRFPMLVDIEFRGDGDLVLGLRSRRGDARVLTSSGGDIIVTSRVAERWFPLPAPEYYDDNIRHNESSWGTLASLPWLDQVLSTVIDPWQIYSGGAAWWDNLSGAYVGRETIYAGRNVTFGKASGLGDVEALCEAPTPTATPSVTPTASPSPTATPSITPTATPSSYTIYLPMAERDVCKPESIRTDVVVVLDMSTSMYRETSAGRSKHLAAIDAARTFVDLLQLEPDEAGRRDRIGIVGFNDVAWTGTELTSDRQRIVTALDDLLNRIQQGTRLDLALAEGQRVLDATPRLDDNVPVMILLTDGLPNRVPFGPGSPFPECPDQECSVLQVARSSKETGTRLFTIGLGLADDVLDRLLTEAASQPEDFYFAPDGEDLGGIYRQIAGRIVECP